MFQPNSQPIARFSVAALLLGLASACFGASVNVDFGQFPIPYSGTAVAPDSGTYWSRVPNTSSSAFPLADSSGTLTSVGVEIPNYLQMADWTTPQVAPNLMKDYLYAFNAGGIPYPLSITGLDPSKEYDLYLYSKNGGGGAATGSTTKFIVNGIQKTVANSDNIPNFVLGDNYTLYSGVGPAVDGRLLVEYLDVGGVGAALNGFQLVANVDPNEHPLPPLPPGRGRQLLLQRGLQIQAFELTPTFDFDVDRWLTANFTGINFQFDANVMHPLLLARLPQGHQWGRWFGGLDVTPDELPYIDDFVSFQYWDELDGQFGKPALLDVLPEVEAKYREWNNLYPNTLTMTTSWGGYLNASDLRTYMRATEPDMLFYDFFPGFFATRETWYEEMQKFRTVALEGYDGSGRQPLPYGQQPQASRTSYSDQLPGEAFVRQQQFASWAFGFTYLAQWLYRDPLHIPAPGQEDLFTQMFASRGDHRPTIMFDYVAETNRQSRNLGPALVRMVSTDVRIIPGKVNGTANPPVFGVPTWIEGDQNTGGYTDFLTDIVPLGKDFLNPDFNNHSDAIVGYFKPLLDENSGFTFVDGLSFMIVNGNAGGTTTRIVNGQPFDAMGFNVYVDQNGEPDPVSMAANSAEALGEWYHVAFDFQNSNIDSLLRLSRDTGEVEVVPLIHFADSRYFFTLFLPGGTGDLFAYWDSSLPLPTVGSIAVAVPEPASYWLVVFTAVGLCCSRRLLSP